MNEPIVEQIVTALVERLAAIRAGATYQSTVAGVVRPMRRGLERLPDHLEIAVLQGDRTPAAEPAAMTEEWQQDVILAVGVRPGDDDGTPWDRHANRIEADIRKAVYADRTFGGLALDATLGPPGFLTADDGAWVGVELSLTITYRTRHDDPYRAP